MCVLYHHFLLCFFDFGLLNSQLKQSFLTSPRFSVQNSHTLIHRIIENDEMLVQSFLTAYLPCYLITKKTFYSLHQNLKLSLSQTFKIFILLKSQIVKKKMN